MRLLPWLVSLMLPACAGTGIEGLPVPAPMDIARIERPASPNTALAGPAGMTPTPDLITPTYPVPASALYAAVRRMALGQPRTYLHIAYDGQMQLHFVVRSAWLNFPDLVLAQVQPDGADASRLVLYSRSVYGQSDLGVNRARLQAWLAALAAELRKPQEG